MFFFGGCNVLLGWASCFQGFGGYFLSLKWFVVLKCTLSSRIKQLYSEATLIWSEQIRRMGNRVHMISGCSSPQK